MKIGELFSGYGGLGMGVQSVLGGDVVWHSDIDKGACKILAHRYPDVPNLGDITTVDWSQVEPVDVLTGGYPCQPFSHAGRREGVGDDRHLWPHVATAVGILRPNVLVFENVRGHLSLGFDEVLRDLSLLHYDTTWTTIKAADVGAPHNRARIFIIGRNRGRQLRSRTHRWGGLHRDSRGWRINAGPAQGEHDRQGAAVAAGNAGDLRGEPAAGSGCHGEEPRDAHLAPERPASSEAAGSSGPDASNEVGCCPDRRGLPVDDRLGRTTPERSSEVERGHEAQGRGLSGTDPGGQPARTGPVGAEGATDGGCPTRWFMVGAGWGPVWPGGVLGAPPDQRDDGGGPDLRYDLTLLPTPTSRDWKDHTIRREPHRPDDVDTLARALTDVPCALLATPRCADGMMHNLRDADAIGNPRGRLEDQVALLPTPAVNDMGEGKTPDAWDEWTAKMQAAHGNGNGHGKSLSIEAQRLLPTPTSMDAHSSGGGYNGQTNVTLKTDATVRQTHGPAWGDYAAAIARWETVLGRPAPAPTMTSAKGNPQLSPRFVEFLMGLPVGWVTDVPDITRNEALRALGNGVVPQQCAAALAVMGGGR